MSYVEILHDDLIYKINHAIGSLENSEWRECTPEQAYARDFAITILDGLLK